MDTELTLTGLDGTNPLGFLAALGTLEAILDVRAPVDPTRSSARVRWVHEGTWHPVIRTALSREVLIATLDTDRQSFADEPALHSLKYAKAKGGKKAWDLKPPPEEFCRLLRKQDTWKRPRTARYFGAYGSEVVTDNNGNLKPTAFHFTAGQQEFLAMVGQLAEEVTPQDFEEALFGPWQYDRSLPVLQWDSTSSRDYALRATDPSTDKKDGVPGADWLGFRALPLFPVAPRGGRLMTTCFGGEWKSGSFRWPLWTAPLSEAAIRTLLVSKSSWEEEVDLQLELKARKVSMVLECDVRRSDQGGYGSFGPARVLARC